MRFYTIWLGSISAIAASLCSTSADACRVSATYMQSDRADRRGDIAAEVEVAKVFNGNGEIAFEANIVEMLHGSGALRVIKVRRASKCAWLPKVGQRGVVSGCVRASIEAEAVVAPFLRSGFYLPPHSRERDC